MKKVHMTHIMILYFVCFDGVRLSKYKRIVLFQSFSNSDNDHLPQCLVSIIIFGCQGINTCFWRIDLCVFWLNSNVTRNFIVVVKTLM
jgi:hypothetical protein